MYRPDVDGLRGIAIVGVVLFHTFPEYFGGGYSGVDIFFVISGFLISQLIFNGLNANNFSFANFYARRIKRIFPALVLVLAVTYLVAWLSLLPEEFKSLGLHIAASAGFIQNFVLLNESGYFDISSDLKPLLHLWSLAVEEQFYLIYPILICLSYRAKFRTIVTLSLLALVSFYLNIVGIDAAGAALFYSPQTRFWEFLAGAMLASNTFALNPLTKIFANGRRTANDYFSALGLALIVLSLLMLDKEKPFPGWQALIPVAGSFLVILAGPAAYLNKRFLSRGMLVFIGKVSYPLYLWHWPILSFAAIIESESPSTAIRLVSVITSFSLAWLSYRFVERPIRFGPATRTKIVILCIALGVLACAGYATFRFNGIESRNAARIVQDNRIDYVYKHDCSKLLGDKGLDLDWCNADHIDTNPPNVLLIGDSVANAYSEMLSDYLESRRRTDIKLAQFGRGECPNLIGYGPKYCQEIVAATLAYIDSAQIVDTVILAANWPDYFFGKTAFRQARHEESAENFISSFKNTVSYYQGMKKRVLVFLPPPQSPDPKSCVIRPFRLSDKDRCKLPVEIARRREADYRKTLLPYLKSLNVDIFDPFERLCNANECTLIDGSRILYYDKFHLSQYGARYLAKASETVLDSLLPAR